MSDTDRLPSEKAAYHKALSTCNREAAVTLGVALFLTVFFWAAIAIFGECSAAWWGMPVWFWLSCIGGYVLSVVLSLWMTRCVFTEVDFEAAEKLSESEEGEL